MATRPVNVLRYGSAEEQPEEIALRAGPLSMIYVNGDLRQIRLGGREVLRRVYVAVRDRNWRTIAATLSDLVIEQQPDAFEIRYRALHQEGEICFRWDATLRGTAAGEITFSMDGAACSAFLRNRIGICVLHPTEECAGAPCRVTHTDGHVTEGALPRHISPHQPYKEIQAIAHEVASGCWAEVTFQGEVFEMEDQRNWTDASFKTYSTPLELPFPVRIERGAPVRQAVSLTLRGDLPAFSAKRRGAPVTLALGAVVRGARPPLGLGVASHGQALNRAEVERLRALRLAHLRVDLAPEGAAHLLSVADAQATSLRAGLEIGLPLVRFDADALGRLSDAVSALNAPVARWLLLTDGLGAKDAARAIAQARGALERLTPQAAYAVGVNAYFTELNRTRPPLAQADLACYSLNPQVHAFDNLSLVETLPAQAVTVESARQFAQGRPLVVSPVTLRPRFNPSATGIEGPPTPGALPDNVDPRQMSLFGAGWTLVSLKHLMGHPAVQSLTYYETTGWRGVMERPQGAPAAAFPSRPGEVFPLYHVLRWVGACSGAALRALEASEPLLVDGLALESQGRLYMGLANLANETQRVEIAGLSAALRGIILDEDNVEAAMGDPESLAVAEGMLFTPAQGCVVLDLAPYAVAWLEGEAGSLPR